VTGSPPLSMKFVTLDASYLGDAAATTPPDRRSPQQIRNQQLERLFREHRTRLLRFLKIRLGSESDALDALQIVFIRLLQRSTSLHEENLTSLLYVCARNVAIDLFRQRRRFAMDTLTDMEAAEVADHHPGPDAQAQDREQLELLLTLVKELPTKCASAFVSYKLHELEYHDIAQQMGVTESMVRKYVIKAVAHCAARFEQLKGRG